MITATDLGNARIQSKYTQVKVSVDPGIAAAFKEACAAANVSMAAELSRFMADYAKGSVKRKAAPDYSTRRQRRATIKRIIVEMEMIKSAEENLLNNAPDNLRDAPIYETADEYISALEDAIDLLAVMAP